MNFYYNKEYRRLIKRIVDYYEVSESLLLGKSRKAEIAEARQVLAFCLKNKFYFSFAAIGRMLNCDHTTIMHSCKKIEDLLLTNERIKFMIDLWKDLSESEKTDIKDCIYLFKDLNHHSLINESGEKTDIVSNLSLTL